MPRLQSGTMPVHPTGSKLGVTIYADGNGGQYIFIAPALDLVVVFTGSNYNSPKAGRAFAILGEYILPAAAAPAPARGAGGP